MNRLKLPIGIQSFRSFYEEGYRYVDKTELIHKLCQVGKYVFLSRPRRFGKSLITTTLKELFLGNKHLFEGLWIEHRWDWQQRPVVLIDFNLMEYKTQPLELAIAGQMDDNAKANGVNLTKDNFKDKFKELLTLITANGQKAVVLIDEYEKAITDFLGEDEEQMIRNVDTLRNFFSVLKSMDTDLHFVFLTGVSIIGKLGIFSGLNNLTDISPDERFAALCGYTQQELEDSFPDELEACAQKFGMERLALLEVVKRWYNGYSWDGKTTLYNPFSILNFLSSQRFANFWFETGTPTFLVKRLREGFVLPQDLEGMKADYHTLEAIGTGQSGAVALLFQTGYLTIKAVDGGMEPVFTLGFPNREVHESFLRWLLADYANKGVDTTGVEVVVKMKLALRANDLEAFFQVVRSVLASVPYPVFRTREDYFHSLMHVMLVLTGMRVQAEEPTNTGRIDQVLDTGSHIYIFEYKLDRPADEALAQIKTKGYAQKYLATGKPITLVGIGFGTDERNLSGWTAENL